MPNETVKQAAINLANEVTGLLGLAEIELRGIVGHTNVNVLRQRLEEVHTALAEGR